MKVLRAIADDVTNGVMSISNGLHGVQESLDICIELLDPKSHWVAREKEAIGCSTGNSRIAKAGVKTMEQIIVLDDGETYSSAEGCKILDVSDEMLSLLEEGMMKVSDFESGEYITELVSVGGAIGRVCDECRARRILDEDNPCEGCMVPQLSKALRDTLV